MTDNSDPVKVLSASVARQGSTLTTRIGDGVPTEVRRDMLDIAEDLLVDPRTRIRKITILLEVQTPPPHVPKGALSPVCQLPACGCNGDAHEM